MVDSLEAEKMVLDNWKKERAELDEAITTLEKRIAARSATTANPYAASGTQVLSDSFFRMTVPDAIKQFLKMVGRPARATTDIVDALNKGGLNVAYPTVYTSLGRLKDKGEVVKAGENWGLDSWYPPAPRTKAVLAGIGGLDEQEEIKPVDPFAQPSVEETTSVEEKKQAPNKEHKLSQKDVVAEYLKTHGPATRSEIIAGAGIPDGSFSYCLRDPERFVQGQDGKWRNVE